MSNICLLSAELGVSLVYRVSVIDNTTTLLYEIHFPYSILFNYGVSNEKNQNVIILQKYFPLSRILCEYFYLNNSKFYCLVYYTF